ncbi:MULTISPECIES: signal peptidase II [Clostridium]|uniref:Lipoprotein signal peptidase n=4 Tax=Clostridium TaxID=1485 RepID=D8GQL6_CLOLD|nr:MULTISPECIES: signal peptidase II [Clostridium]ADK14139.1 predicted signal peptidase [Clostridium ljungdahlii DSM 13528]AGY77364.1 signal peptidase II [Clostridium autoethanogenum DSM 10061]ALU37506.1 Lipoprotein signal peptidase [Clostridium autoethanogenum DSM 10061]OAA86184.1 Lipoprotein signal peptidase [Clostridium ljungdahlii DSM 13528]OAA89247.1 Lipoprotein signal peptidase [Clostridium coskatii]
MEIFIILLGILIDRVTKIWAIEVLSKVSQVIVIKDLFSLLYLQNKGAAFGILQGKLYFLTIITIIVVGGMIFYIIKYKPSEKLIRISFSLIISGALGNLMDRMVYKYVVDFISVHYKDIYYFPVFNIADVMVVVGTALLAFYLLKEEKYGK